MIKLPETYNRVFMEKLVRDLERRIEELRTIRIKRFQSVSSEHAPNLAINEIGYVLSDDQDMDFIVRAEDSRVYRISSQEATPESEVSTPAGLYVLKAGDTMTGLLVLSGDPSAALGAATKQYADTKIAESTLTTKGDLVVRDASDVNRLAVGSSGQILIPDSTSTVGLDWANLVFNNDVLVGNNDEIVTV